jgi:hypothetical protein
LPLSFGKITAGLGPYVAYGLNGRYNLATRVNGQEIESREEEVIFNNKTSIASTSTELQRWDLGANFTLGLEIDQLFVVGFNYARGMTDVDKSPGGSMRNSYAGISIGLLFSREDH